VRVLIPTQYKDIHAQVVQRALQSLGHTAVLWYGGDLPTQQTLSWALAPGARPELSLQGSEPVEGEFDVVWLRRRMGPTLPEDIDPADLPFVQREWRQCLRGVWATIAPRAFWVNPVLAADRGESKLAQLALAAEVGLSIPPTLCSSDPDRIRAFLRSHPGQTIYKPFTATQWRTEEGTAYLFTAVVDEDELDDESLRACPGLFQPRIDKSHELRVTFMGQHTFVTRLDSQSLAVAQVDWRAGTRALALSRDALPAEVEARCRALMARFGLVFACFDFIVTPRGEHVFLELNQMGQFLWLEELDPSLRLLDAFCAMLTQARPDFEWSEPGTLSFADFHDEALDARIDARHVEHGFSHLLEDEGRP
jgi:hypothetical protein